MSSNFSKFVLISFLLVAVIARQAHACPDIDGLADINCDGKLRILAFGDSITAGEQDSKSHYGYPGRLKLYFPSAQVYNLGLSGETTYRGRSRAPGVFKKYKSLDYVIVLEGVNDYFAQTRSSSDTRARLFSIIDSSERYGAIGSLSKLTRVRRGYQEPWVEAVNSRLGDHATVNFFKLGAKILSSDKLHPNASGYSKMAIYLADRLKSISEDHRPRDSDHDGIYNFEESKYHTSANNADTDGDGLTDGDEIFVYGTNPTLADTDGDGIPDGVEVSQYGSNPTNNVPSAPKLTSLVPLGDL